MQNENPVLIGIGANVPYVKNSLVVETCWRAALALDGVAGLSVAALSRWYVTEPVPPSGQPPYINGVVRLQGWADPADLLEGLQSIEERYGRTRSVPNAARTLDLDIIAMGALVRSAPDPVIPHPRMHERAFVLSPLLDVAPGWRHPVLDRTAGSLLAALPPQGVRRLGALHLRDALGATN